MLKAPDHSTLRRRQVRQTDGCHQTGTDIIVARPADCSTPLQRNTTLKHLEYLVLDEADRMPDMGFMPDVKKIIQKCPDKRHTLLFRDHPADHRDAHPMGDERSGDGGIGMRRSVVNDFARGLPGGIRSKR